jgi:hypothetical protein
LVPNASEILAVSGEKVAVLDDGGEVCGVEAGRSHLTLPKYLVVVIVRV